jgi:hypothetical protein
MVTIGLDQLRSGLGDAVLDTGTTITAGQVRRLACNATLVPVVLGTNSAVLDLGLSARLFDRYQRLALTVRDGGCVFPGCDRPAAWCEAHHVRPWSAGGGTDMANGCLLCPHHHRLIHTDLGWEVSIAADGVAEVTPPARLDPARTPQRHSRPRHRPRQPARP